MGPRLISRGKPTATRAFGGRESRFNGAAADQPRKVPPLVGGFERPLAASMGPRLISRGKPDAERHEGLSPAASMGPRLISRGKPRSQHRRRLHGRASMGPRLISRGKQPCGIYHPPDPWLQWGRG